MKKNAFVMLFVILLLSFFLAGCMESIEVLKPPSPSTPQVQGRTIILSWSGVDKARNYLLSINRESSDQSEREISFPYVKQVSGTSCEWTAPGVGVYSWKVRARNDESESRWSEGENFRVDVAYEAPNVTIISPTSGENLETLTPTIQWTAQPGTLTQVQPRAFELESCEVLIFENGTQIHAGFGTKGAGNNWSYQIPAGVLDYWKQYGLKVIATQGGALAVGQDQRIFIAPAGLDLELSETSLYNCGIITATVTAKDPDIDKIALFAREEHQQGYVQIAPSTGWWALDVNRQAVFVLETNEIGPGLWLINAQSSGSSSKSVEKSLEIKDLTIVPELSLTMCGQAIENGQYVYIIADRDLPTTAAYTVDVDLDEELSDIISEFYYVFEFAGADTLTAISSTYTIDTWQATDIVITMATECIKVATLTVFGTSVYGQHPTSHWFEPVSLSFTLDGALPEIEFKEHDLSADKKTLTIPVHLSDTKSLSQATLSFFIEKEDVQGNQMTGWEIQQLPWGTENLIIGTGNNETQGTITYSAPIVFGQTQSVDATILLSLGELDGATLTCTLTAIDFIDDSMNICSGGEVRPASADSISVFFDNVFYKKESVNISFLDSTDCPSLGDSWLLTSQAITGLASFCFSDAYIDDFDDIIITFTGPVDAVGLNSTNTMVFDSVAECTGYPFKNEIHILLSLTAIEGTETSVEAEINATDNHLNPTQLKQRIIIDTQPPMLDSVDGKSGDFTADDYVEFTFRQSDKVQAPTFEGATLTVNGNPNKKQWYEYLGSVIDYPQQRGIVRLNEDHQFRVNFDASSYGLIVDGTVTLEINASDKYGNTGYTTITGNVSNP